MRHNYVAEYRFRAFSITANVLSHFNPMSQQWLLHAVINIKITQHRIHQTYRQVVQFCLTTTSKLKVEHSLTYMYLL